MEDNLTGANNALCHQIDKDMNVVFFFSKTKQKISTTTFAVFQQLKLPIVCIDVPYSRSSHLGFGCIVMQSVFSVQCTPPSFKHPISGSPPSLTSSSSKEREKSETSREDPLVVAAGDDENDHLEDETTQPMQHSLQILLRTPYCC